MKARSDESSNSARSSTAIASVAPPCRSNLSRSPRPTIKTIPAVVATARLAQFRMARMYQLAICACPSLRELDADRFLGLSLVLEIRFTLEIAQRGDQRAR